MESVDLRSFQDPLQPMRRQREVTRGGECGLAHDMDRTEIELMLDTVEHHATVAFLLDQQATASGLELKPEDTPVDDGLGGAS